MADQLEKIQETKLDWHNWETYSEFAFQDGQSTILQSFRKQKKIFSTILISETLWYPIWIYYH